MEISLLRRIYKWEHLWLCLLVIATLAMHFAIITNPPDLMFDEQHYVKDARSIIQGTGTERPEHPPLGKLFIVAGIRLFGDKPWNWRFFSMVCGTAGIILFYFLCRSLGMSRTATNVATYLLSLENMTFTQASIAMLDVYFYVFMLASFLLYFKRKYISSGIAVGLSGLAKLNGALALPALGIHWLLSRQKRRWWAAATAVMSAASFIGLMPLFDYFTTGRLLNPIDRIKEMLSLSGSLTFETAAHEAASRPWEWLLSYKPMFYWYTPHYIGGISYSIWALIIPTVGYMTYKAIKGNEAGLFGIAWFASTYLFWIPVSLITNRVSFIYYFYPAVGAICLGLGLGLAQLWDIFKTRQRGKLKWTALAIFIFYLLVHLSAFIVLTPVFIR